MTRTASGCTARARRARRSCSSRANSYTHGNAVADDATYPAALERILRVPTANLGVSGYGPDQALLRLESAIERFPNAKVGDPLDPL